MARVLWLILLAGGHTVLGESNAIPGSSRMIASGDELVASVIDSCFDGDDSVSRCMKLHTLSYLDHLTGRSAEDEDQMRSEDDGRLDDLVLDRVQRVLNTHEFKVQLPELLQGAVLSFRPTLGDLDVSLPPAPEGQARVFAEGTNSSM